MPKVECPVCGRASSKPPFPPHRSTIAWGDCACSDHSLCLHHRYSDEPLPERPSNEVLDARAQARHVEALAEYEATVAKYAQTKDLLAEVERLRADVDLLKSLNHGRKVLTEKAIQEADAAFQRGVAATKDALIAHFGPYGMEARHIRALPDLKDENR